MPDPVVFVVDEEPQGLGALERELRDRYARSYRITCTGSATEALESLEELAAEDAEVALVLVGRCLAATARTELMDAARRLHPDARRGLVIAWGEWGDRDTGEAIFDAMGHGLIDHYLLRPGTSPDEAFHQAISSLLLEWAESQRTAPYTIRVVGEAWSGRAYELRETLGRCAIPHSFSLAQSPDGRDVVAAAGPGATLPLVAFPNGAILANPTNTDLALAAGSPVGPERIDFDVVIIGAGPAGLSAAVYGASEGFSTLVVDEGGIGGQATSSSLIRNYLGFPRGLSGRRLAQQAYDQAWVFGSKFAFMNRVTDLVRKDDELLIDLSEGGRVHSRAVILAMGATYRRLNVPELEDLNGAGVFYGGPASEGAAMADRDVYVLGGANSAGQAALHLARYARSVTIVIRAESLDVGMSDYLVRQIDASPTIAVRSGTEIVGGGGDGWLATLVLRDRSTGESETVPAEGLFLMIGARPRTEWLPPEIVRDAGGFVLTGPDIAEEVDWPVERERLLFETGMPAVFAAGDVRRGSPKRVASAVGEGSVAVQLLHRLFALDSMHPRGRAQEPGVKPVG